LRAHYKYLDPSGTLLAGVSDFVRGHELDWLALHLGSNVGSDDSNVNALGELRAMHRHW